jgi:hypothetical protein
MSQKTYITASASGHGLLEKFKGTYSALTKATYLDAAVTTLTGSNMDSFQLQYSDPNMINYYQSVISFDVSGISDAAQVNLILTGSAINQNPSMSIFENTNLSASIKNSTVVNLYNPNSILLSGSAIPNPTGNNKFTLLQQAADIVNNSSSLHLQLVDSKMAPPGNSNDPGASYFGAWGYWTNTLKGGNYPTLEIIRGLPKPITIEKGVVTLSSGNITIGN